MSRRFRITLVWILTMVIPVYGMASVSMLLCSPAGRTAAPAGAAHDRALHDASLHGGHAHAGEHAHHASSDPAVAEDAAAVPHHAGQKCSACASCCSGVALPSVALALVSPPLADAQSPPLRSKVREPVMPGPERPPRAFAA